ncbi:MAG: hypothetical protein M3291_03005 [Actinomycetota bacterium]|nr:hypothetical protein [Actinomycetota bacterium]
MDDGDNLGELDVFAEPGMGDTFTFTDTFLEGGDGDKLFDVDVSPDVARHGLVTCTYDTAGSFTSTVPVGVAKLSIPVFGAQGGQARSPSTARASVHRVGAVPTRPSSR